jgi:hypothetical protein
MQCYNLPVIHAHITSRRTASGLKYLKAMKYLVVEEFYLLGYKAMQLVKSQPTFRSLFCLVNAS